MNVKISNLLSNPSLLNAVLMLSKCSFFKGSSVIDYLIYCTVTVHSDVERNRNMLLFADS